MHRKPAFQLLPLCFAAALQLVWAVAPAQAWTPRNQVEIGVSAAQLAPPDLVRQIAKHRMEFQRGVLAPFRDGEAMRHVQNPDGSGQLEAVIAYEIDGAVQAIRSYQPFEEIVYRLGVVAHYVADASNPLNTSSADSEEGRYFADYASYAESAAPRFQPVFYGLRPELEAASDLSALVTQALERGRSFYPLLGQEYRRIGWASGRSNFDDRSTAFGVASLSFSHAVSDVAEALRFVWLKAGGADPRRVPRRGEMVVLVPRPKPVSAR